MSTDDPNLNEPERKDENRLPGPEETFGKTRPSPAVRLFAWLLAVVLLLVIFGWVVSGIL